MQEEFSRMELLRDYSIREEATLNLLLRQGIRRIKHENTFTSNDSNDPLEAYLMMSDNERANTAHPIKELRSKMIIEGADDFVTFKYTEEPRIFHQARLDILCDF